MAWTRMLSLMSELAHTPAVTTPRRGMPLLAASVDLVTLLPAIVHWRWLAERRLKIWARVILVRLTGPFGRGYGSASDRRRFVNGAS